jgi:hypothetical protein
MPDADYLALGQWNAICDRCGRKFKSSRLRKDWQGFMVCERDWEPRHPQDFVRNPHPERPPEWVRPPQADIFVEMCTLEGQQAIPGMAIPGCAIPGKNDGLFLDLVGTCTVTSILCRANLGSAGCATVGVT